VRRPPDVFVFAVSVILWALLLSAVTAFVPGLPGYGRSDSLIVIPVASVMLSARGATWKRRLLYAGTVLVVFMIFDYLFVTLGAAAYLLRARGFAPAEWAVGAAYVAMSLAFPAGALLVFVGRDPSMLWTKSATIAKKPSAKKKGRKH
jgi:hypothetical protein